MNSPVRRGMSVVMQDDGNLVQYGVTALWDSGGYTKLQPGGGASGASFNTVDKVVSAVGKAVEIAVAVIGLFGAPAPIAEPTEDASKPKPAS